jgi:exodeoxyribonuclease VII large subunit
MAVPVLADVASNLASLALRTERCARRYHERARERLDALVRVLPRRDALLGPQRQKMDDLGSRLGRALERRLTRARGELDRAAGALRPAVLEQRLSTARHRLEGASRLLDSVNPDNLLQKGYVRVEARATGKIVTSVGQAQAAGAVRLQFRDGAVDARVERGGGKTYEGPKPEQGSLL